MDELNIDQKLVSEAVIKVLSAVIEYPADVNQMSAAIAEGLKQKLDLTTTLIGGSLTAINDNLTSVITYFGNDLGKVSSEDITEYLRGLTAKKE